MTILVAYASKHGSTRTIANRIATILAAAGHDVEIQPADTVTDPDRYTAAVIGSAVYYGRWLADAADLVRKHPHALAARPVWLFSSGPLGGQPITDPPEAADLVQCVQAIEHRTFSGALDRAGLRVGERIVTKAVMAPDGDYRDWAEIDRWARGIARHLTPTSAVGPGR
jgi:menaquinone-dependent protoporphyrinogen oxidase